jgi:hypothetical protein
MKKSIFLVTVVLAIALIYSYGQTGQKKSAENHVKQAMSKDVNTIKKSEAGESRSELEDFTPVIAPIYGPRLFMILTNYNSKAGGSSSFLQEYLYPNPRQSGC